MLPHERYRLAPRDDWISFDVVGVEHGTLVEDDLERAFKRVLRSTLKSCRDSKSFEKTLPSVDILLEDGKKERVVVGLALRTRSSVTNSPSSYRRYPASSS